MLQHIRRRVLRIDPLETTCAQRGFTCASPGVRLRLERIGRTFLDGYHAAIGDDDVERVGETLERIDADFKGFAFEGAAMGFALLDWMCGRGTRLSRFAAGAGAPHRYMVHVGAGWAIARLPWRIAPALGRLDSLLRWLALDGYGFHEGYFHWPQYAGGRPAPRCIVGYGRRVFDQGLGRSLWFVHGADAQAIASAISGFAPTRQSDLWSGVGLAACYAGGAHTDTLASLHTSSGAAWPHLAQGAAFAITARVCARNATPAVEYACACICGADPRSIAALVQREEPHVSRADDGTAYEQWRAAIRRHLCAISTHRQYAVCAQLEGHKP